MRSLFWDKIYLHFYWSHFQRKILPHFIDKQVDRTQLNPVYIPFRKVYFMNLWEFDYETSFEYFYDIRDLELNINKLYNNIEKWILKMMSL